MNGALSFRIRGKVLASAVAVVALAVALLGLLAIVGGASAAVAAYLGIMALVTPARSLELRWQLVAAVLMVVVAALGFAVAPLGVWPTLIVLVAVCVVQGVFAVGESGAVTRLPANLVAFAALSGGGELWQAILGVAVGATFILAIGTLLPRAGRGEAVHSTMGERLEYGVVLAIGCVLLTVVAEAIGMPHVSWALLSFCLIVAAVPGRRQEKAHQRVIGTIVGAVFATGVLLVMPSPIAMALAIACAVLCIAYLLQGEYVLYVSFLTPALMIMAESDAGAIYLGAERIGAVLISAALALALNAGWAAWRSRKVRRQARSERPSPT